MYELMKALLLSLMRKEVGGTITLMAQLRQSLGIVDRDVLLRLATQLLAKSEEFDREVSEIAERWKHSKAEAC